MHRVPARGVRTMDGQDNRNIFRDGENKLVGMDEAARRAAKLLEDVAKGNPADINKAVAEVTTQSNAESGTFAKMSQPYGEETADASFNFQDKFAKLVAERIQMDKMHAEVEKAFFEANAKANAKGKRKLEEGSLDSNGSAMREQLIKGLDEARLDNDYKEHKIAFFGNRTGLDDKRENKDVA